MNLADLLSALAPYPVLAPPEPWVADFEAASARNLFRALLQPIPPGPTAPDEPRWTLSNLVVRADPADPEMLWPRPGEHVAVTLNASRACDADWRWPDPGGTHPAPGPLIGLLAAAGVAFAYGRREEATCSVTIAFPRSPKPR